MTFNIIMAAKVAAIVFQKISDMATKPNVKQITAMIAMVLNSLFPAQAQTFDEGPDGALSDEMVAACDAATAELQASGS